MLPAPAVSHTVTECFSMNNDLEKNLAPAHDCGDSDWCQMLNSACHHSRHAHCTMCHVNVSTVEFRRTHATYIL